MRFHNIICHGPRKTLLSVVVDMIITNKGNASKKRRRCVITVLYGTVVVLSLGFLGTLIVLLVQNLGAAPIKKDRYDRWKVYQIPEPDQVCAGRDDQSLVFAVPSNWTVIMSVNHGFLDFFENWWYVQCARIAIMFYYLTILHPR